MAFPWWVLPHHASWYTSITVPRDPIVSIKWPITWATNPSHFAHVALRPIRSSFFSRTSTSSKDSSQVQRSVRRELGSQLVAARRSFKISNISHCVDGFKISNHFLVAPSVFFFSFASMSDVCPQLGDAWCGQPTTPHSKTFQIPAAHRLSFSENMVYMVPRISWFIIIRFIKMVIEMT